MHCILFISQKTLEADEILEKIVNPAKKTTNFERNLDKWNNFKQRIVKLTKNLKMERPEYIFDSKTKQVTIKWLPLDSGNDEHDANKSYTEVNLYESYISKIKEMILLTKENEIHRLALECNLHRYEERFKTTIKDLISCIVGVDASEKYLATIYKQQKLLSKKIESTKTFNFTSKLL